MLKKKNTIYDVAREAGVSPATVSRVINNNYPISKDVHTRVLGAIDKLEYVYPRKEKTNNHNFEEVAVVIPSLSNPFYTKLLSGVESVLLRRQRCIFLCNTYGDANQEIRFVESLLHKKISGVIISSVCKNTGHLQKLYQYGIEMVAFDQNIDLECNRIIFDYHKGSQIALKYLSDLGHKHIAFMGLPLTRRSRQQIFATYKRHMEHSVVGYNESHVCISDVETDSFMTVSIQEQVKMLTEKLLKSEVFPTAIFCVNDNLALCVIKELKKHGLGIPKDISVVGFDNINSTDFPSPSLTTVDQCAYEMGSMAAELMTGAFKDKLRKKIMVEMQPQLIVRESTGEPRSPVL